MTGGTGLARQLFAMTAFVATLAIGSSRGHAQNVENLESELKAMQDQMRVLQRRVDEAKQAAAAAEWAASQSVAASRDKKEDADLDL